MSYHKKKLISLIVIAMSLGLLSQYFGNTSFSKDYFSIDIFYGIGMLIVAYTAYYVVTLKCPNPNCKKHQIIRGTNDYHWPGDSCYECSTKLTTPSKK